MKRVFTSLIALLVVFVIFALVVGPLRTKPVELRIPFFPTIQMSAEALAYVSFLLGLMLATAIAFAGDIALRRRFRRMMLEQEKRLKPDGDSGNVEGNTATAVQGDHEPLE